VVDTTAPEITCPPDTTCPQGSSDPDQTGEATCSDNCGECEVTYSDEVENVGCVSKITRTWTAEDECGNTSTCEQIITCVPECVVTNSSLCCFDCNAAEGQQFRILFTPDVQNIGYYKLTATNPGQTYYNVFYSGTPGDTVKIDITLPFPYVTQGANPVHAYDGVTTYTSSEQDGTCPENTCFTPGNGIYVSSTQVTLASYTPQDFGSTYTFSETVTIPASGFIYLNVHLDYGLKKTGGYSKTECGGAADNNDAQNANWCVYDGLTYAFSNTATETDGEGNVVDSAECDTSVSSFNVFKKNPGVGGQSLTQCDTEPVPGCTMKLLDVYKRLKVQSTGDEDGWYMLNYKHIGKAATFYVTCTTPEGKTYTKAVILKANAYAQVNFEFICENQE
jgi:hypothetical protein